MSNLRTFMHRHSLPQMICASPILHSNILLANLVIEHVLHEDAIDHLLLRLRLTHDTVGAILTNVPG